MPTGFDRILFGGGRFIASGGKVPEGDAYSLQSADGLNFHVVGAQPPPGGFRIAGPLQVNAWINGAYHGAAAGPGNPMVSSDGVTWRDPVASDFTVGHAQAVGSDGQRRSIAYFPFHRKVGYTNNGGASQAEGRVPYPRRSDARAGTQVGQPATEFTGIVFGASQYVAVDQLAGAWTTTDGKNWISLGYLDQNQESFSAVAYDGIDRFVAVGGAPGATTGLIGTGRLAPPNADAGPTFSVTAAVTRTGDTILRTVSALGSNGQLGGTASIGNEPRRRAALSENGVVRLPTAPSLTNAEGIITALRADGSAVGIVTLGQFPAPPRLGDFNQNHQAVFVPPGGVTQFLPTLPNVLGSVAWRINANGVVLGEYFKIGSTGIFLHDLRTGQSTDLGLLGFPEARALGLSDAGHVVGRSQAGEVFSAWSRNPGGTLVTYPNLGGIYGGALAVNASGAAVGYSSRPYHDFVRTRAALFQDGQTFDLDLFNTEISFANDINNRGEVIGFFTPNDPIRWAGRGATYYRDGNYFELNELLDASGEGWYLTEGLAINDAGEIVANGVYRGEDRLAILRPSNAPKFNRHLTKLVNVSTRLRCGSGDEAAIAGFSLRGPERRVLLRVVSSLLAGVFPREGGPALLQGPTVELFDSEGRRLSTGVRFEQLTIAEQFWVQSVVLQNADTFLAATLSEGNYTAVVRGSSNGICLVEAYSLDARLAPELRNISTRGLVGTGDEVMIAGFVVTGTTPKRVLVRALGPTLSNFQVPNVLSDPEIQVVDRFGRVVASNQSWQSAQELEIRATGFAPPSPLEAAVVCTLEEGSYTAIVRGTNGAVGNALVEVYVID